MKKLTSEEREHLVFRLSFISTSLALFIVLLLVVVQIYVRWTLNQNFTFLGGSELEALTISAFVMLLGLSFIYKIGKHGGE